MVNVGAFLAGGLLQGVGAGIMKQAEDARAIALEQYKTARETALQGAKIASEEGIASRSNASRENAAKLTSDATVKAAELRATGAADVAGKEIKSREGVASADRGSREKIAGNALAAGAKDVVSTQRGADGNLQLVTKGGSVVSTEVKYDDKDRVSIQTNDKGELGTYDKDKNTFTPGTNVKTGEVVKALPKPTTNILGVLGVPGLTPPAPGAAAPAPAAAAPSPAVAAPAGPTYVPGQTKYVGGKAYTVSPDGKQLIPAGP